ncbi:MAG: hypothetical protein QOG72_1070 [Sphingomonadales bacterium]|nr:hypothetical protein [Sphingomonadales bacterium]
MVSRPYQGLTSGPGRFAPARLLLAALLLAASSGPAAAQVQRIAPAAVSAIPDETGLARLVWSTMAAVDHANKTGNYAVLRGLGSPAFQASNSERMLAGAFAGLREQRINLSDTLSVEPSYEFQPGLENGMLRIRGAFRMRPQAVQFDLLYQWNQGWMLQGVAVRTVPFSSLPPAR